MPRPQFTTSEEYLIKAVQSTAAGVNTYMWGYVIGGILIAAFAAYHESIGMLLSAFALVCGFRIYEEYHQKRWMPVWRSIIDKYEQAVGEINSFDSSDRTQAPENSNNP